MAETSDYTPTTDEVRVAYIDRKDFEDQIGHVERRGDTAAGVEFDRWLEQHDAELAERLARKLETYNGDQLLAMLVPMSNAARDTLAWAVSVVRGEDEEL